MNHNFAIVRTGGGTAYANRIARSIRWINEHKYPQHTFSTKVLSVGRELSNFFVSPESREYSANNTTIYARAAYPDPGGWMRNLIGLEQSGYTVINSPEVLMLTSNKLACSQKLQGHFPHPTTWCINKSDPDSYYDIVDEALSTSDNLVMKPETSISQGASVIRFSSEDIDSRGDLDYLVSRIPSRNIVVQELVPYTAIYRVIVIGGTAMPYSFVDRPTEDRWKVSVCLNRTSMQFVPNPDPALLRLGEQVQTFIGGEINFIDFFETEPGNFVISEINTACNLRIHEVLARDAGHPRWNIHYNIAKYLVERSLV